MFVLSHICRLFHYGRWPTQEESNRLHGRPENEGNPKYMSTVSDLRSYFHIPLTTDNHGDKLWKLIDNHTWYRIPILQTLGTGYHIKYLTFLSQSRLSPLFFCLKRGRAGSGRHSRVRGRFVIETTIEDLWSGAPQTNLTWPTYSFPAFPWHFFYPSMEK